VRRHCCAASSLANSSKHDAELRGAGGCGLRRHGSVQTTWQRSGRPFRFNTKPHVNSTAAL